MSNCDSTGNVVELKITGRSGIQRDFVLAEGTTLIVGQGQNCGLRLDGEGVSAMHCVLRSVTGS